MNHPKQDKPSDSTAPSRHFHWPTPPHTPTNESDSTAPSRHIHWPTNEPMLANEPMSTDEPMPTPQPWPVEIPAYGAKSLLTSTKNIRQYVPKGSTNNSSSNGKGTTESSTISKKPPSRLAKFLPPTARTIAVAESTTVLSPPQLRRHLHDFLLRLPGATTRGLGSQ